METEPEEKLPRWIPIRNTRVFTEEQALIEAARKLQTQAPAWVALHLSDSELTLFTPWGCLWRIPLLVDLLRPGMDSGTALRALTPVLEKIPLLVHDAKALKHELRRLNLPDVTVARNTLLSSYLLYTAQKSRKLRDVLRAEFGENLPGQMTVPQTALPPREALERALREGAENGMFATPTPLYSLAGTEPPEDEEITPAAKTVKTKQEISSISSKVGEGGQISWLFALPEEKKEPEATAETEAQAETKPETKTEATTESNISAQTPDAEGDSSIETAADLAALCVRHEARLLYRGLLPLLTELEQPLTETLFSMESDGFQVDRRVLRELGESFSKEVERSRKEFFELSGLEEFNLNSPKQLGEALFEKLSLPALQKKGRNGYSTSAEVLEELSPYHPCIESILRYRKMAKLQSTYIDGIAPLIGGDNRIHTTFDQTAAVTGRISSLEPNLQNIPVRSEEGREIRRAFVAKEGHVLVDADYSQIELRVLAHLSGDQTMLETFRRGEDIHTRTAAEIAGVPLSDVTPEMRRSAKAVNFGIVYGISSFGLSRNAGISMQQAKKYIEAYFRRYPGVKAYMENCVSSGRAQGYSQTLFGRRRELFELFSANRNVRNFGERAAMNTPVQGTAADLIKLAMVQVEAEMKKAGLKARLILQVHDELIVECPVEETETVKALLKRVMENAATLNVPLVADVSVGNSWEEAH